MIRASAHWIGGCAFLSLCVAALHAGDELKRKGMMGIRFAQEFPPEKRAELKAPAEQGILIEGTVPGSAAEDAGLAADDVLLRVGDAAIPDMNGLVAVMRGYSAGDKLKLTLWRKGKEEQKELTLRERPRETSPDFDILYDSAKAGSHRVRTVLTKPKTGGKRPAVLFIQSLTAQSVEFPPQMPNHPYRNLLHGLTKAGYVTMRVERIGVGDSEGESANALSGPLDADVAAFRGALEKLRSYEFVDPAKVYVFTHGLGGAIAPLVAADAPIAGVAVYGGMAQPPAESFLATLEQIWKVQGELKPEQIQENVKAAEVFLRECFTEKRSPKEVFEKHPDLRAKVGDLVRNDLYVSGRHYGFFQQLAAADLPSAWKKVNVPVLALWGKGDYQTNRADHEAIARWVNGAHPGKAKFVEVPGVDHLFNKAADQEESFLAGSMGEFNAIVIETFLQWGKEG